jgi:fluoroacetyl-CoA thioesterase
MKSIFKPGDEKQLTFVVSEADIAIFPTGIVHLVYSTFALTRDVEWTTRQFVLDMRENDEEGIGTMISAAHHSPALLGEEVVITGRIKRIFHHEIICSFEAKVGKRLIASGETGQKILKREKFEKLFSSLKK